MSLGDLDELILKCRNEEARAHIAEAVYCYKAGAFRACVVATWIAVVYDLLAKIRELALGGDAEAQKITTEVASLQPKIQFGDQGAIGRILQIERDIVDIANDKFAFFDGQQVIDLHRLQDDRNRCAHPTYQGTDQPYSPSPELARAHLVHAVRHVLATPPVQGKAATEHIIRLVASKLFPTDLDKAKVQLRSGGLDRPKESLVKSTVDHLLYGLFEGDASLKGQSRAAVAIRATYDLFPGLCEPRVRKAINAIGRRISDGDMLMFFLLQKNLPQMWGFLEQDNQTRLIEFLRQSTDQFAVVLLPICFEIPTLEDTCRARVNALDSEQLSTLLQVSIHPMAIARAVDIYCSSGSYDRANANFRAVEPILSELNVDQIRRILLAPVKEGADLNGAYSFTRFVKYVYDHEKLPRDEIIQTLRENGMEWIASNIQQSDAGQTPF